MLMFQNKNRTLHQKQSQGACFDGTVFLNGKFGKFKLFLMQTNVIDQSSSVNGMCSK